MKTLKINLGIVKKVCLITLFGMSIISCDSSSDPITPNGPASTFEYLFINSFSGPSNSWDLNVETTAGVGFNTPTRLRGNDVISTSSVVNSVMNYQCSAYDKINKKYLVSSGQSVVVYDVSTTTPNSPQIIPTGAPIQAMEFVNGRLFMVENFILREYNTTTGAIISNFTPISLASTGGISNLTTDGIGLYIISSNKLYNIDINPYPLGVGRIVSGYPKSVGNALFPHLYNGLEFVNSAGCPNSLYVVRQNYANGILTSEFVKIDPNTASETILINNLPIISKDRISSALDYTTEYYYFISSKGPTSNQHTVFTIDLTPTSGTIAVTRSVTLNNYSFGLQLKD